MSELNNNLENVEKNESYDAVSDNLSDYSDELCEMIIKKTGIFCQYKEKKEIGELILKALEDSDVYGVDESTEEKGFFLYEGRKVGLISQNQGIQTLSVLLQYYDNAKSDIARERLVEALNDIVKRILRPDGSVVFDASPYETNAFNANISYIDSITWTISTIISVLSYNINNDDFNLDTDLEDKLIYIANKGMEYINDAYIKGDNDPTTWDNGWNFTKNCKSPSLYFCYAVSEYYVDIYDTFDIVIRLAELETPDFKHNKKIYAQYKDEYTELKNISKSIKYKRMRDVFKRINGGKEPFEIDSLFQVLDKYVKSLGSSIWETSKDKIADNFLNSDLKSIVDVKTIENSYSNEALFNTLFAVNIIVNSGLDDTITNKLYKAAARDIEADIDKWQYEYDNLFQVIKLSFERVVRCYNLLKSKDKEYIVDQYILGFGEEFGEHKELAKLLRKKRIRGASIVPLIVSTNAIISKYLIKYPQNEMIIYLEMILKNRYKNSNDEYMWRWDKEGYSSLSTYYYVTAIDKFYDYYNEYEKDFFKIQADNEEVKQKIRAEYKEELDKTIIKDKNSEIEQLSAKVEALEEELKLKKEELDNISLEGMLRNFIANTIKNNIVSILNNSIEELIHNLLPEEHKTTFESTGNASAAEQTRTNISNLQAALYADLIIKAMENNPRDGMTFEAISRNYSEDIRNSIEIIINQVQKDAYGNSTFVDTVGYSGIKEVLDTAKKNKKGE